MPNPGRVRASTRDDAPRIEGLCTAVLEIPSGSAVLREDHLWWKYGAPGPRWAGSRSFVWEQEGELLAHAGIVPLTIETGGDTRQLVQLIDWAARPDSFGAGVALLRDLAGRVDGALSVRGSAMTRALLKPLGFRSLGVATRMVSGRSLAAESGVEVQVFSAAEALDVRAGWSGSAGVLRPSRSRALVEHWLECPVAKASYANVFDSSAWVGGVLLMRTPGQVRICDVDVSADEADIWLAAAIAGCSRVTSSHAVRVRARRRRVDSARSVDVARNSVALAGATSSRVLLAHADHAADRRATKRLGQDRERSRAACDE